MGQNVTFCNEDLKQVYHEVFDEALAAYNAKKKKIRDKIPEYYEHIRFSRRSARLSALPSSEWRACCKTPQQKKTR